MASAESINIDDLTSLYGKSIDIVLATCNGQQYIESQIDSILDNEAYQQLVNRFIIVDDASSRDEISEFLTRCTASGLDNLKVLRNAENCGVSYSLNKAADNATGVLYAPVDHDDMVVPFGYP